MLVPYIVITAVAGFTILIFASRREDSGLSQANRLVSESGSSKNTYLLGYIAILSGTVAVFSYWLMTHFDVLNFPNPSSHSSIVAGSFYLVSLSLAVATGLPFMITRVFPSLRVALANRRSLRIAIIVAIAYFFTYLIMVNQIVITAFNTSPGNVIPPPGGVYPFASAITAGPAPGMQLESAVYVPLFTIQLNPYFNVIIMPFEFAFAIALSILVAASVALALYLISRTAGNSCYTGATVSGMGSFFGFTATCPTCLAPTLVSVLSGGVSSTVPAFYTHVSGILLPPLVSILALLIGLSVLDYQAGRRINPLKLLISVVSKNSTRYSGNADYDGRKN